MKMSIRTDYYNYSKLKPCKTLFKKIEIFYKYIKLKYLLNIMYKYI